MRAILHFPYFCTGLLAGLLLVGAAAAQPFERIVDPFPVRDADSTAYDLPLLGGFNTPRPQFVDIDADGDPDLFVQERSGQVAFFENTGTAQAPRFTWQTDRYADLAVGEWARFADLDGDGDHDLLAEQPFSLVRYYRNEGTPQAARFVLAADTLFEAGGQPLFADRQNVPALADLDCDSDLDLFLGKIDGTLTFYRHDGLDAAGRPQFTWVSDRYQDIEIIGDLGKATAQHGANALAFADVEGDGDADLLWGDFFSPSLYLIENTGTCDAVRLERTADTFPPGMPVQTSGYNASAPADLDGDGGVDLVVGVIGGAFGATSSLIENLYHYENTGAAGFTLRATRLLTTLDEGDESVPALGDLDGDGDLDLLLAAKIDPEQPSAGRWRYLENTGTPQDPQFAVRGLAWLPEAPPFHAAPALGDLDDDGDLDLLAGAFDGSVAFYRNDGTARAPAFVLVDAAWLTIPSSNAVPALGDLDDDGDLDLLIGDVTGALHGYANTGTATQPVFTPSGPSYEAIDVGGRSAPALHDLDGDGDLDLLIGTAMEGLQVYRNIGTPKAPAFSTPDDGPAFDLAAPLVASPALGDLDGDGDADLLLGGQGGGLVYFANQRTPTARAQSPASASLAIAAIYPNPVRTTATIRFRLAAPGPARLAVYDVLGRRVAVLVDAERPAGMHALTFDAAHLPSGVYVCRLTVGAETRHRRLLLLR